MLVQDASAATLKVVHPSYLKDEFNDWLAGSHHRGEIRAALGNYGHFQYGSTIKGRLHYPLDNTDGCREFTDADFDGEHLQEGRKQRHVPLIMVDRGNCHFTKKSLNIQKYGGALAVVVDSKASEDPARLVMADDFQGASVNIPSFIISKASGQKLKDAIHPAEPEKPEERKNHKVILQAEIVFGQQSNDPVKVDLWYSSVYELYHGRFNLPKYAQMQNIFKEKVIFQPRFVASSCQYCSEEAKKQCVGDGEYCPVLPAGVNLENRNWQEHVKPEKLIAQRVREQCVFESLADDKKANWFFYIDYLAQQCISNHFNSSQISPVTEQCN